MLYKATLTEKRSNFEWYNALLSLDEVDFAEERTDTGVTLIDDECYGLYDFVFEDGSSITIDLCHGSNNYFDDCVWHNSKNTQDIVFDCNFSLDKEMEFVVGDDTYKCLLELED